VAALIFDFDGVIADSEALANVVLAEHVSALGSPTTLDDALERYSGRRWQDVMAEIERHLGRPLPAEFSESLAAATLRRFETDLKEVDGAQAFLRRFADVPRCIASSSSLDRIRLCLRVLGMTREFGGRVFSAESVVHGKPHPEIFLSSAAQLGTAPRDCLVIEDSVSGIRAAVAAGMTVIGLHAASHIRGGHADKLRDAGAVHLAPSWEAATPIAEHFLSTRGSVEAS
jgi:HAD superfamily hydrolase (TIGR01509 family)